MEETEVKTEMENTENEFKDANEVKDTTMAKKWIYNPVTGKYYEIRQKSSKHCQKGQIKGLWPAKKKKHAL